MKRLLIGLLVFLGFLLLQGLAGWIAPVDATKGKRGFPGSLVYTHSIGHWSEAARDTIAWHDVVVTFDRPEMYRELRDRRSRIGGERDLRFIYAWQPQWAVYDESDWWHADTTWSPLRLIGFYAQQNDWWLYNTRGERIRDYGGSDFWTFLNWTRHCPVGTYGTSKGLRASEWIAEVVLPWLLLHRFGEPGIGEPWSWDNYEGAAQNALILEVFSDCLGTVSREVLCDADPNRDGIAEGTCRSCSEDGNQPYDLLTRMENFSFWRDFGPFVNEHPEMVVLVNDGSNYGDPMWRFQLSGMKMENFMASSRHMDWWDWFYGSNGIGYYFQEQAFGRPGLPDRLQGWDVAWITAYHDPRYPNSTPRRVRLATGTALLGGQGMAQVTHQGQGGTGRLFYWPRVWDMDLGQPSGEFQKELHGQDTLYTRGYRYGLVEVNPNAQPRNGIGSLDARFTYWCDGQHFTVRSWWRFVWPQWYGLRNLPDVETVYHLRASPDSITAETWDAARQVMRPVTIGGAATVEEATERVWKDLRRGGLIVVGEGTTYLGLRAQVLGRWSPVIETVKVEAGRPW